MGSPKIHTTLAATTAVSCTAKHCCSCQHFGKPATGGAPGFKYNSGNTVHEAMIAQPLIKFLTIFLCLYANEGGEGLEMPYIYLWRPAIPGAFLFPDFSAYFIGLIVAWSRWIVTYYHWYGSIVCVVMIILRYVI